MNGLRFRGEEGKKVENPKGIDVKNSFSILDQMDEESNIARHKEDGTNNIVLGDSQVKDLGIELSNIRKFRAGKGVVMCYPGVEIEFIKDRLEVAQGSRIFILHVGRNSIRNRDETFERSETLLKKYRELLVRAKEIRVEFYPG